MLDLYDAHEDDKAPFGDHWCCKVKKYPYGEDVLVARYEPESDGQTVEVYLCAMPAQFYRICALATPNSVGEVQPEWSLTTGSGEGETAAIIAEKISEGMLGLSGPATIKAIAVVDVERSQDGVKER